MSVSSVPVRAAVTDQQHVVSQVWTRWFEEMHRATEGWLSVPVGAIIPHGGQALPSGFLWCLGTVEDRSTYPDLFAAIGTAFNTGGELATQFRLPNQRDVFLFGAGGAYALGAKFGTLNHLHTQPAHAHPLTGDTASGGGGALDGAMDAGGGGAHPISGATADGGAHGHAVSGATADSGALDHDHDYSGTTGAPNDAPVNNGAEATPVTDADHTHGYGGTTDGANASLAHAHDKGTLAADAVAAHSHAKGTLAADAIAGHVHGKGTLAAPAHTHGKGTLAVGDGGNQDTAAANPPGLAVNLIIRYLASGMPVPSPAPTPEWWGIHNVRSLGLKGDGATDDAPAFASAIAVAHGQALGFPPGQYRLAGNITVPADVAIVLIGDAVFVPDGGVTLTFQSALDLPDRQAFGGAGVTVLSHEGRPQWWGAVGDDTGDQTSLIQKAIDAAFAIGGGIVVIGIGTYRCLSGLVGRANVTIRGQGYATCLHFPNLPDGTGITSTSVARPVVRDLQINGAMTRGVLFNRCTSFEARRCWIFGATLPSTAPAGLDLTVGINIWDGADGLIEYNYLSGNGFGGGGAKGSLDIMAQGIASFSTTIRILHNTCASVAVTMNIGLEDTTWSEVFDCDASGAVCNAAHTSGGYGIYIYGSGDDSAYNWIHHCRVRDVEGNGLYAVYGAHTVMESNRLFNVCTVLPAGIAIPTGGIAVSANPFGGSPDCSIINNIVVNAGGDAGISIDDARYIVGWNEIVSPTGDGIQVGTLANDAQLIGNIVVSPAGNGIVYLAPGGAADIELSENRVIGAGKHGIYFEDCPRLVLRGNKVSSSYWHGIVLVNCHDPTVDVNHSLDNNQVGGANTYKGIALWNCPRALVGGNRAANIVGATQYDGLYMNGCADAILGVNQLYGNTNAQFVKVAVTGFEPTMQAL
jgi:parallel beta-helix repeat protein